MEKRDGGQAFPRINSCSPNGMSLRQWYAGIALHGMRTQGLMLSETEYADRAFKQADAMIKQGEKGE